LVPGGRGGHQVVDGSIVPSLRSLIKDGQQSNKVDMRKPVGKKSHPKRGTNFVKRRGRGLEKKRIPRRGSPRKRWDSGAKFSLKLEKWGRV